MKLKKSNPTGTYFLLTLSPAGCFGIWTVDLLHFPSLAYYYSLLKCGYLDDAPVSGLPHCCTEA